MTTITILSGQFDSFNGVYRSANADDWSDLQSSPYGTWANWRHWNTNPQNLQLRIDDDLLESKLRSPRISFTDLNATITSASLKISDTGAFSGEETTYTFVAGTEVEVIAGRYYRWNFTFTGIGGLIAEVYDIVQIYDETLTTITLKNVNTASLQTSTGHRIVEHSLGTVDHCEITAHDTFTWVDRAYALPDDWNENTITPIPGIITKSPLTIILRDHFGVEVDGIVDITIRGIRPVVLTTTGIVAI